MDWLNQNSYTAYPFDSDLIVSTVNKNSWIVDAGILFGPLSEWVYNTDITVTLDNLVGDLIVTLASGSHSFVFTVPSSTPANTTFWVTESPGSFQSRAFITIGKLDAAAFAIGAPVTPTAKLLQTKAKSLAGRRVTTLNVANKYSALYVDEDCSVNVGLSTNGYSVVDTGLSGDITLQSGRHMSVILDPGANQVLFGLGDTGNFSVTTPCQALRPVPASYNAALEPQCADMLYTFNGVGPNPDTGAFNFNSSQGVLIEGVLGDPSALQITFVPSGIFGELVTTPTCVNPPISSNPYNPDTDTCQY